MKHKRLVAMTGALAVMISALYLMVSCTSVNPIRDHGVSVNLAENQYEILGRVEYRGIAHNVLGLFSWGGAAYSKLYEKAKAEFGADDVINLSLDYEQASYGIFYNERTYIMSGLAVKYKK
ncbi:hypothetical protein [Treponema sp. OMZ 906]|uniref:hypothetical protein n=1 Tax=Treponema sp. OMZ 906 TaxID=2563662 RepID=UPI0020A4555B|nr:hypothetical protein [Treponema sp. OMZ 906]UTC56011.1 hypothetical protein E4N69_02675 [Treponema sp. OMZ 906]